MTPSDPAATVETLPFLVTVEDDDDETMGLFRHGDREVALRDIPVAALRASVRRTLAGLRSIFDDVTDETGRLRLREAQFNFEVSAKGGFNLIGTSEVATKGAITLIFRE
ncbi:MAG: hypothetical protein JXA67_18555 [Micromonosporaceae bacterium]|nr:hypothetical protein [Micromonosporaceae bacterium]